MPNLKKIAKSFCLLRKTTRITFRITGFWGAMNLGTKKTPMQKILITLLLLTRIMVDMEVKARRVKFWVDYLEKILICFIVPKANLLILQLPAVIPSLSKKIRNKVTKIWAKLNIGLVITRATMSISILIKSWKTSIGLGALHVSNYR